MRLGIMGGTFDPIHHGHLAAADEVAHRLGLDEVLFVPTGQPWQKTDRVVTAAEDRYLMTVIATAAHPRFRVSRIEVDRAGQTYTVDTLKELTAQHPDADLFFITGADALTQILGWVGAEEVLSMAHFVGVSRPGYDLAAHGLPDDRVTLLEVPALAISSSDIRARIANGEPVRYLLPPGVGQFIEKTHLYRT